MKYEESSFRENAFRLKHEMTEKEVELARLNKAQSNISKEISEKKKELDQIKNEQSLMVLFSELVITDHAMLRYLERMEGMDMEELRNKICPLELRKDLAFSGDGDKEIGEHVIRVKHGTVMTVFPKDKSFKAGVQNKMKTFVHRLGDYFKSK